MNLSSSEAAFFELSSKLMVPIYNTLVQRKLLRQKSLVIEKYASFCYARRNPTVQSLRKIKKLPLMYSCKLHP